MNKANENRSLVVGLDIGTSKIVVIAAEVTSGSTFEIIGMGSHPSSGLKKRCSG